MLEVLITLIILSIGLLTLAKSQFRSLQNNNTQYFYNVAVNEVINLAEIIRAYHATSQMQQRISAWKQTSVDALPNGMASIEEHNGHYQILLAWREESSFKSSCNQPDYENYACVSFSVQAPS